MPVHAEGGRQAQPPFERPSCADLALPAPAAELLKWDDNDFGALDDILATAASEWPQ